jgi:hypothetical protein
LTRIEAQARLDQARARDLDEVILVLPAMCELSGKPLGEPEMRDHYLVKDLLPPGRPGRFSLDQQLTGTFGQLFTGHALVSGC